MRQVIGHLLELAASDHPAAAAAVARAISCLDETHQMPLWQPMLLATAAAIQRNALGLTLSSLYAAVECMLVTAAQPTTALAEQVSD